jgi:hypothetical protein
VIEATQKKLREAKFFLRSLNQASQEVFRNEPEASEFYLSAFLSAARSVTFALQYEEKDKYDAWFPTWFSNRSEDDRRLLNFLKEQRNFVEKCGGAEISVVCEFIPITEVKTDNRGHPAYGFHWIGPPGTPPPRVGLPVHFFDLSGDQNRVTSACKRYMDVLDDLVRDFIQAHSLA